MERGEDVNKTDQNGRTGLMCAVIRKHNAFVELLLSQPGVDVNWMSIGLACMFDNVEALKMLLAHPNMKSHNVKNREGMTPLRQAIHSNSTSCFKVLLKNGKEDWDVARTGLMYLMDEHKEAMRKEKAENAAKFARLDLTIKNMMEREEMEKDSQKKKKEEVKKAKRKSQNCLPRI